MHDMERMDDYNYRDSMNYRDGMNYRDDYRDRNYRGNYRDYMNYRDEYGRNQRDSYGRNRRNYRSYREDYVTMLEDVAEDGMELARAYEDVSEMATDMNEKQKLMKIAEREKEHYRTTKQMLEKHM